MLNLKEKLNKNNYLDSTFNKKWYADFFLHFYPGFIIDPFHNKELKACLNKANCILQISIGFAMIIFPGHCVSHCWVYHCAAHSSINYVWLVFIQFSKHYLYDSFPIYCFHLSQFPSLTKLWHWYCSCIFKHTKSSKLPVMSNMSSL